MEIRLDLPARAIRQALIASLVLAGTGTAAAAPKTAAAKAAFDEGVAAFQAKDYATAAAAMKQSYALEEDPETLFAWAQVERLGGHCDLAMPLFEKLLAGKLPEANAEAVRTAQGECKAELEAAKPPPVKVEPKPDPIVPPPHQPPPSIADPGPSLAVPGILVGLGVVGIGVGVGFFVSAHSAESAKTSATNYFEFERLRDKAETNGRIALIAGGAGIALAGAGIAWWATHRSSSTSTITSAWIDHDTTGLVVSGAF